MPEFLYTAKGKAIAAVAALAVIAAAVIAVFSLGSGGSGGSATTTTAAGGVTPSTLEEGAIIAPNSIQSVTVTDISDSCKEALVPIRALMERIPYGLSISEQTDLDEMNKALETFRLGCSPEEQTIVNDQELAGWFNSSDPNAAGVGAPGSDVTVPAGGDVTTTMETAPAS